MDLGYAAQIKDRIQKAADGTIFINSDFVDIADTQTVRRNLNRLTQSGMLRRILSGIYEKPGYSSLLNEYIAPDPDAVAHALARNYHWTIAPSGNTALNLLGLSTQVPSSWTYISDGPYKTYGLDGGKLEFKHRTNKEITGFSPMSSLVVQSLKAIGRENITPQIIAHISGQLSSADISAIIEETKEATDWVYDIIRKICREP